MNSQNIPLFLAFLAGLMSFFSPCILPLIPAYISLITGISVKELIQSDKTDKTLNKILLNTCFFILGFSIIFIILGASATFLGNFILTNQRVFQIIGGIIVIILGLHLKGLICPDQFSDFLRWNVFS